MAWFGVDAIVGDEAGVAQEEGVGTSTREARLEGCHWIARLCHKAKRETALRFAHLIHTADVFGVVHRHLEGVGFGEHLGGVGHGGPSIFEALWCHIGVGWRIATTS